MDGQSYGMGLPTPATALRRMRVVLLLYWIALALGTHWPDLDLGVDLPQAGVWQANKIMHAGAFAGLCLLLIAARPLGRRVGDAANALAACLIAAGYSVVDEYTQVYVGRNASIADAVANLLGILSMYLIVIGAAPTRRWPSAPVYAARAFWLLAAPTLALITLLPAGNDLIIWFLGHFGSPRAAMTHTLHLVMAMTLIWTLALAAPAGRSRPHLSVAVAIGFMALAGPSIEQLQAYTGRGYSVEDVYHHFLGMLAALTAWAVLAAAASLLRRPR